MNFIGSFFLGEELLGIIKKLNICRDKYDKVK